MLYEVTGDLVNDEKYRIFCHQTNCKGVMGSGIAKKIADKYPVVPMRNKDYCKRKDILGTFLPVKVTPTRVCINLYGQEGYGRDKQYTDYKALETALNMLSIVLQKVPEDWCIGFPYRIGCGLGGGNWQIVKPLLEAFAGKVKQDVYIVKLKGAWNEGKA